MTPRQRRQGGYATLIVLAVLAVAVFSGPVVLHFMQKQHDRLPFDVDKQYPPGKTFVGGEVFASTLAAIMDHELSGRSGWRPNDFFLWGPLLWADNNANRQMGIIRAVRESTRVLRDHLTKVSSTEYDPNLRDADTLFRNDARKFWLPSAENRFRKAVAALHKYVRGLHAQPPTSKPLNGRNVELMRLFQAWMDLLGGAHANLFKERETGKDGKPGHRVRIWTTDDYFYQAQGYAHVMYHLMRAVRIEYATELENRATLKQLFAEVIDALGRAAHLKPLVVLNGTAAGLLANHRRNLDGFIVDARQKMYSIREELDK